MVRRRPALSLPRHPPQSPPETGQHRSRPGVSRLQSLPLRHLPPQPLQPPQPLKLHLPVKVTRGGAGGGGGQAWQGEWGGRTSSAPRASPSDVPSAPLLLAVEDVSDSSVTVSWEPPERLGRLGLQGYVLELCREGGELWAKPCGHRGGGPGAWLGQPGGRYRGRKCTWAPPATHLPPVARPMCR